MMQYNYLPCTLHLHQMECHEQFQDSMPIYELYMADLMVSSEDYHLQFQLHSVTIKSSDDKTVF